MSTALVIALCLYTGPLTVSAQPEKPTSKTTEKTVEELTKLAKSSLVVIKHEPRPGQQHGLGAGFVVSEDGLIATNLHVIGEARPITVELENGKSYPVTSVHASDRFLDLALLKIDAKGLKPLELGDSSKLIKGQSIVALGHPQGLQFSVVSGVISGTQVMDGHQMLQLAIPIEPGNSGGPVLDKQGKVQGIVTLKSLVTSNLGFAMPINDLKKMLAKPNPIPMARWVTIGKVNPDEWSIVFQGTWRQQSGKIIAEGAGEGFGGRSLCLSKAPPPQLPFEIEVTVRLDDESGAGGLVFHADGGNKHYGFYPSAGKLRLSRFEGPDVFSWKVLENLPSDHYQPGEWNTIKVRVEPGKILCYVNNHLLIQSTDDVLKSGKVGLVKFRDTHLEFKNFRMGTKLPSRQPSAELLAKITKLVEKIDPKAPPKNALVETLVPDAPSSITALRDQAKLLEQKAAQLKKLAKAIHQKKVLAELQQVTGAEEDKLDLLHAALLIARLDNEELDIAVYLKQVDRLAKEIKDTFPANADEKKKIAILNQELFAKRGFHGSRSDFYNKANSYLHQVLDDREGLPITLSLLYMELARKLDLKVVGIGLPGHFVVQHRPKKGKPYLIDVFEGGKFMSKVDAGKKVQKLTGEPLKDSHLAPMKKKEILVRMLMNLGNIARDEEDLVSLLRYQDAILTISPDLSEQRLIRSSVYYQLGDSESAIQDLDWLIQHAPDVDREKLIKVRDLLKSKK